MERLTAANATHILAANPHIHYENDNRGYFLCEVDKKQLRSELRVAPIVSQVSGTVEKGATFVIESDHKGIRQDG